MCLNVNSNIKIHTIVVYTIIVNQNYFTSTSMKQMNYIHVCRTNYIIPMKGAYLGELEELILLTVGVLYENAYGVAIKDEIEKQVGRKLNISAVHAVLKRLEDKSLINSWMGGATTERGGRRKRLFTLTSLGKKTLEQANEVRSQLYNQIPKIALQFNTY